MDLNKVILIGRLTRNPEMRYTQSGSAVANFSLAVNRSYGAGDDRKEQVSFFNCIAWIKLAELIIQYCKKGDRIGLEGRLQQRTWDQDGIKRSTVEIVAENIQFLTPKNENEIPKPEVQAPGFNSNDNPFSDDDIPF